MALCTQCHRRPRPKDNSRLTCRPCDKLLTQNVQEEQERKASRSTCYAQYFRLIKWKGHLVGVRIAGPVKVNTELMPYDGRLVACTPIGPDEPRGVNVVYIMPISDDKGLPREKLIDLDQWLPDWSAETVKVMKRSIQNVVPAMKRSKVDEE